MRSIRLIKPLTLGNRTFPVNIIQGPLAGVSCAPFRELTWRYSRPAFSCTEMISCKTLLHKPLHAQQRFVKKHPAEGPVCYQLSSNNPKELGEAVKIVTDYGADLIDLNCGCPVKKIRSKGAGSRLLTRPNELFQLITAMKQNTHVPVSVKIRVEGGGETFNQEVAQVITEAGADFVIVHGRHWTEHYETACRYDEIRFFVEAMKIPVIGNGDVADVETLNKMLATGCDGVMVARAGVGQPWLIGKLIAGLQNQEYQLPDNREISSVLLEHVQGLIELLGNEKFAILQARKFAKYYARHLPERPAFFAEVNECSDMAGLQQVCERYFV